MVRFTDDGETTNIPGKHMASGSVPYSYRMRGKLLIFYEICLNQANFTVIYLIVATIKKNKSLKRECPHFHTKGGGKWSERGDGSQKAQCWRLLTPHMDQTQSFWNNVRKNAGKMREKFVNENLRSTIKNLGFPKGKFEVFDDIFGVSKEKIGSVIQWNFGVSKETSMGPPINSGVFNQNLGVFDETLVVYNENLGVSNEKIWGSQMKNWVLPWKAWGLPWKSGGLQ